MFDYAKEVFTFKYRGFECDYVIHATYERLIIQRIDGGLPTGIFHYPIEVGTYDKVDKNVTLIVDSLLDKTPINELLAARTFDKELEELLKNG